MELLAVATLGCFAAGYVVLGGADVGVGMLLPFLGRSAGERGRLVAAIVPFLLVDEVWLVATAGVVAGAFPALAAGLLGGLLPAVVALLSGHVVRDLGVWLRNRFVSGVGDAAVTTGSWAVALSWGWIFAGLLAGITDRLAVGPATLLAGAAIATLVAAHGLAAAALRLSDALHARVRALSGGSGDVQTCVLTSTAMAALCLVAGFRLPLAESAADPAALTLLVPAMLVVALLLVGVHAWRWRILRRRVKEPSCPGPPP